MPPAEVRIWSVADVNRTIRSVLEAEIPALWVGGEVANWTRARSGHCYFTLKDASAQLRCVLWRRDAERLPADPEEGMRVRAFGGLTLYEARGDLQLTVRRLEGEGEEGLWRLAFERLRTRLAEEGLLDPLRKRPLPKFPRRIGVVTSTTGAALHDILSVLARRAPWVDVVVRGTRVQGEGASVEVAEALRVLVARGKVDVVIVARGGGSIEDLWAFNEEPVARAIAESPVPVISAVGHEVDVTISDLVADLRAPTPSAAAEAVVPDGPVVRAALEGMRTRLGRGLRAQTERRRHRVVDVRGRLVRGIQAQREPARRALERGGERSAWAMRRLIAHHRERLARGAAGLEALSPLSTLRRGYAIPLTERGRVLRGVEAFRAEPDFELRVVDGRVRCRTIEVHKEDA